MNAIDEMVEQHISETEKLLTPKVAARMLGVTPQTLWRWARDGKVRVYRLPSGRLRYPEREIKRILSGMRIAGMKTLRGHV